MNTYSHAPSFRQAPTASIQQASTVNDQLVGKSPAEVAQACQWDITSGTGKDRQATGETFVNVLLPRLFSFKDAQAEPEIYRGIYANFNNVEGSAAVFLAEALSMEFLKTGAIPDKQYFFKLIDSRTKLTLATDMPEYEKAEESVDSRYAKPVAAAQQSVYIPDPKVCAFLHIYAEVDGRPVRIASQNIEVRYKAEVDLIAERSAEGWHIQAGMDLQSKVSIWDHARRERAATLSTLEAEAQATDFSELA
jgi:hypothetical protein